MSNQRRARRAKQVRRHQRRAKARDAKSSDDTTLSDIIRSALVRRHPGNLLSLACTLISVAKPETLLSSKAAQVDSGCLDQVLTSLIGVRNRETTALLAVIAELLVDDPGPQLRCREELAERGENLPRWITGLPRVVVYRGLRRTHVLGEVEELVMGVRLDGGSELTVAVEVDHNMLSGIADVIVVPDPIDEALARAAESGRDIDVVDMKLADVRTWIQDALEQPSLAPETDTWPLYRVLVRWLVRRLPEGGEHRPPATDWRAAEELCGRFFATSPAAMFTDASHRELLLELFETGTGDPTRWSAARVAQAIGGTPYLEDHIPLEVMLDAPDLLRAFIPYAHAESGIRDELTSQAIAVLDELRSGYKRHVLDQANQWDFGEAV